MLVMGSAFFLVGTGLASAQDGPQWLGLGPPVANVEKIVIDHLNPSNIFFVNGNDGQIERSTDAGQTWFPIVPGDAVAINPSSPNVVLAAGHGLFRSVDGGTTWNQSSSSFPYVKALSFDPIDSSIVYAGTECSAPYQPSELCVLKSIDGGISWTPSGPKAPDEGNTSASISAIAVDARDHQIVFAVGEGIYKSTDAGRTWTDPSTTRIDVGGGMPVQATGIVIDPGDSSHLFLAGVRFFGIPVISGFFTSLDGGKTWLGVPINALGQSGSAMTFDTLCPATAFFGTQGVYFQYPGHGPYDYIFSDGLKQFQVSAIAIDPIRRLVYAGTTSTGIYTTHAQSPFTQRAGCERFVPVDGLEPAPITGRR